MNKLKPILALLFILTAFAGCKKTETSPPATPPSVTAAAPVAAFRLTGITYNGAVYSVTFNNTSQKANSYSWNFGDDSPSKATNPMHNYLQSGIYIIVLTATGPGGTNKVFHTDTVRVDFTINLTQTQYNTLENIGGYLIINNILVAYSVNGYIALSGDCTYDNTP